MTAMETLPAIATVTLNAALDQTALVPNFQVDEVNRVEWEQTDPGGKGINVAAFLRSFGFAVTATGFLGSDNLDPFQKFLADRQISNRFVQIPGKTRVNVKIVDKAQNTVTDINFPGPQPPQAAIKDLLQTIDQVAETCEWFVLSGSLPAGITPNIYKTLIESLKNRGKNVVLDTSKDPLARAIAAAPFAIKPNIAELQDILGRSLDTPKAIVEAARELVSQGIHTVIVSMGADGALFVEANQSLLARPPKVEVVSTVGAGDAMVSGFVTGKLRDLDLATCARLATAFSLGALSQIGPRLPPIAEVEAYQEQVTVEEV